MLKTFNYVKNRFLEASTWSGIGVLFLGAAAFDAKLAIGSVICGAIAIMMPDYTPGTK
jgi:hypothetical protein